MRIPEATHRELGKAMLLLVEEIEARTGCKAMIVHSVLDGDDLFTGASLSKNMDWGTASKAMLTASGAISMSFGNGSAGQPPAYSG